VLHLYAPELPTKGLNATIGGMHCYQGRVFATIGGWQCYKKQDGGGAGVLPAERGVAANQRTTMLPSVGGVATTSGRWSCQAGGDMVSAVLQGVGRAGGGVAATSKGRCTEPASSQRRAVLRARSGPSWCLSVHCHGGGSCKQTAAVARPLRAPTTVALLHSAARRAADGVRTG
jgi:hypothetical protein